MIVKMRKVMAAVRESDREALLKTLEELGVMHLSPVDAKKATASESLQTALGSAERALQVLNDVDHGRIPPQPEMSVSDAVDAVLQIERANAERESRLTSIYRQVSQQAMWGDVSHEQLEDLQQAGVVVRFCRVDAEDVSAVKADFVQVMETLADKKVLLALVEQGHEAELPESAEIVEFPRVDNPTLKAEAAEIENDIKTDSAKLHNLKSMLSAIETYREELAEKVKFDAAERGGYEASQLYAVQGWVPVDKAATLGDDLKAAGLDAGLDISEPEEDELPPTLIRYAKWAHPIKGLFEILGTYPGYREIDLSSFFMISLPLFAAILIGDAGYGLIFLLLGIIFYKKLMASAGKAKTHLLITVGAATLVFGMLSANYFGITPNEIAVTGGYAQETPTGPVADIAAMESAEGGWASIGKGMMAIAPLWDADSEAAQALMIKLSFLIGSIHLILGHLRKAAALAPDPLALAEIGWCVFLVAMLGVIWVMFFGEMLISSKVIMGGLIIGGALAILFSYSSRNPIKRVLIGLASSLLPALGTFSDTMSYIRLMAVGMASYYIASAFNQLGSDVAASATWIAGAPILIFGHGLNIALAIIAIFAHGVRLNMLEFSSHAGVQWAGYEYNPFSKEV